ncbi:MAG TPA: 16S rRNA (cytosine(1402)-N(4))-methyltransferase RsmH [Candidatus Paceibacterota bacterium]|nr:16S rRNA (cytosine(1402)-N(4))-methyltransferase RsmH [Candidatus Paceibacterota bacterium]
MHLPVLLKEVIQYLKPQANEDFIDATFGEGGHSLKILEHNKLQGKVLGIEIDKEIYEKVKERFKDIKRLILVNGSYTNLKEIVKDYQFYEVNGVLFDFGICTYHLEESGRGFTYKKNEPLDMRFDVNQDLTAKDILNWYPEKEIEKILREFGEERYSFKIAKAVVKTRKEKKFETTMDLVELLKRVLPRNYDKHRLPFPTRTFQALRIATNNELENIKKGIDEAFEVLKPNGRLVVISFHSLEDRIIKNFFKELEKQNKGEILTKKPITPSKEEISLNPKSSSAKLRTIKKINK